MKRGCVSFVDFKCIMMCSRPEAPRTTANDFEIENAPKITVAAVRACAPKQIIIMMMMVARVFL